LAKRRLYIPECAAAQQQACEARSAE
jgi:hypothetical protein